MEKIVLKVEGMSCGHCAKAVTNAVTGIPGVSDVSVNLEDGSVSFCFNTDQKPLEAVEAAITEEGFTVRR